MTGKEYIRIVEGSDTAVLFIHGILGTPDQFKELIPLVPEKFSVHNLVLDGHSKGVRDFSKTSMKKWERQVRDALEKLAETHENIIIVGHSMGTLLGTDLAIEYENKVKLLFLLNVPLTPWLRPCSVRHSFRVMFECVRENRPDEVAAREAYGIDIDRRLWLYIGWVPRFLELFKKAANTKKKLAYIKVPCRAYQSRKDELVSNRSEKILRKHDNIITTTMSRSSHYLYDKEEKAAMLRDFEEECNNLNI